MLRLELRPAGFSRRLLTGAFSPTISNPLDDASSSVA
jgi:hypothetical protein